MTLKNNNLLKLPPIDTNPENYANQSNEKETYTNSINSYKTIEASKEKDLNKSENEIKQKMNNMRNRTAEDLEFCLKKTNLLNIVDVKKLQKGLSIPLEKNSREMMNQLKLMNKKKNLKYKYN